MLSKIKSCLIKWCLRERKVAIGELVTTSETFKKTKIYETGSDKVKFIGASEHANVAVKTPTGYSTIKRGLKTVPYTSWYLNLDDGKNMHCADNHKVIVPDQDREVFVKDLKIGDLVYTEDGVASVKDVHPINNSEINMYDLELDDELHLYYTNGILSHNTETSAAYLLWYAIFHESKNILIVSNKSSGAMEIIGKIQNAYEELPMWLKPGIDDNSWNKHECKFENKSRIKAEATSEDSGRGMAISLLYADEFAFVGSRNTNNLAEVFWTSILPTLSCLDGNTLVLTDNGFKRISDMFENIEEGKLVETDDDFKLYSHKGLKSVSHKYISPSSKTLTIRLRSGREITCTPHHPLMKLTSDGGTLVKSEELNIGDSLRVDRNMQIFGKTSVSEDMAYMLGGYIAEGFIDKKKTSITICNTDFNFRKVYLDNGFKEHSSRPNERIVSYSMESCRLFESFGIEQERKCYDKIIPSKVFGFDKQSMRYFIAGMFDGDGSVTDRSIHYGSTSKQLVQELQLLLANFGIVSKIYESNPEKLLAREQKNKRLLPQGKVVKSLQKFYSLNIPLSQYSLFEKYIPLKIKRKREKLRSIILKRKQDDIKQFYINKKHTRDLFDRVLTESGKSVSWFRKTANIRLDKIFDSVNDRKITQNLLGNLIKIIKEYDLPVNQYTFKILNELHDENVFWDDIVEIVDSYRNNTYDFTVPESSTFLQNGIMGSNTGGNCIISSTPNGDINMFAQLWRGAVAKTNDFVPTHITWDQPPGRDEHFKREKIGLLGELKWRQEYECEFISSDAILIDSFVITQAEKKIKNHEPAFTIRDQEFWHPINPYGTYLVGVDPGTGSGLDYTVVTVYEFPSMRQVAEYRENTVSSPFIYNYLKNLLAYLTANCKEVYFSVENNGVGNGILSLYEADESIPDRAYLVSESTASGYKLGFFTTAPAKMRACLRFKQMFESGNIHVYSKELLTELKSYKRKRGAYEAESGATDDSISATLIIMRMLEEMAEYDERAYYKVYTANIDLGEAWEKDGDDDNDNNDFQMPFLL